MDALLGKLRKRAPEGDLLEFTAMEVLDAAGGAGGAVAVAAATEVSFTFSQMLLEE